MCTFQRSYIFLQNSLADSIIFANNRRNSQKRKIDPIAIFKPITQEERSPRVSRCVFDASETRII